MTILDLVGTDKQKRWAFSIIEKFQEQNPGVVLPNIRSAEHWIRNRDKTLDEIISESATGVKVTTPFTRKYPLFSRNDAIAATQALGNDFIVLDLETSGLKRDEDEIIEIAMVHYGTGETLLNTLLRPMDMERYRSSHAKGITKIEVEELQQAPTFLEVAPRIEIILNAYSACSYNASFDFPFLQYQYLRYGLQVPKTTATCAMKITSAFFDTDTNISLERACRMMKIEQEKYGKPHRALNDVLVTIELLKRLAKIE